MSGDALSVRSGINGIKLYEDEQIYSYQRLETNRDNWHIVLARKGASCLSSNGNRQEYGSGIIMLPPAFLDKLICAPDVKGYMLSIPNSIAMDMGFANDMVLYSVTIQNPFVKLGTQDISFLEIFFRLIRHISARLGSQYCGEELICLCQALVITCKNHYDMSFMNERSMHQDQIVNDFIKLVIKECRTERKLNFYSEKLNISVKHLSAIISSATGKTASHWIEEHTIMEAKEYLKKPGLSISTISEELKFSSSSDFSKYFKNVTGMTPNEYRKLVIRRK